MTVRHDWADVDQTYVSVFTWLVGSEHLPWRRAAVPFMPTDAKASATRSCNRLCAVDRLVSALRTGSAASLPTLHDVRRGEATLTERFHLMIKSNLTFKVAVAAVVAMTAAVGALGLTLPGPQRAFAGQHTWLNTSSLRPEELRGKVVLVNSWTYSCINSSRALPYVRAWAEKYKNQGLVVIGVHTPEFEFEKDFANVRQATAAAGLELSSRSR